MKWQTAGMIGYMVLMTIYCLVILILSSIAYSKFSDSTQTYLNMAANYKETYLVDITVGQTECASGYSSLNSWVWGGTQEGCDCASSTYLAADKKMNLKSCNSTQTQMGCTQMNEINGMTFNYFGPTVAQKANVCVKRAEDSQAFYKIAAYQLGTCSAVQKLCGNPSLPETVICVDLNSPCPIYQIVLSASADTAYAASEWSFLNTASGAFVYYNQKGTTATTLPTSEVRFTQGSGVCFLDNNQKNLPSGTSDYILNKNQRVVCDQTDTSFIETSISILESAYYQINLSAYDVTQLSSQSGNPAGTSSYPFKSYRRPYINWKITERYKLKDFVECAGSVKNIKTAQLACVIINVIVTVMVIALQVFQVYNLCGKDVPCIKGSGEKEQLRIIKIKKILTYGSKLLQVPKKSTLRSAADGAPSDLIYNIEMDVFATNIEDNVYSKNLGCLIMYIITIVVDAAMVMYTYCAKRCKKDSNNSKKPKNNQSNLDSSRQQIYNTPKKQQSGSQLISPLNPQQSYPFQGVQLQPVFQGQLQPVQLIMPQYQPQQVVNVVVNAK